MFQIQFMLVLIYALSLVAFQCQLPRVITYNFFIQSIIFVLLFGNFYIKTYLTNPKPSQNGTAKKLAQNGSEKTAKKIQ